MVDLNDKFQSEKKPKKSEINESPLEDHQFKDAGSDQNASTGKNDGRWTNEEHDRFCIALKQFGKDWN